ncbi:hypothetical protein P175DRAFT_0501483 [Aspergillus ochraceoroseus IBT 24754]|uniref:tRNA-specific adenosine-34 deaminase subunit Tad3 n=3 Tax=Aspergillus subgen. Nidulantes TaxID=2720870 RepID=A0A0F8VU51_9EURO|nr:uncharacterized protein P175DRAFT_0501483 [Aspergillus ochraceoroseus IBT 24754]KKK12436.1 hypothetical protein AOCH_000429 [Aspergillus ochraceoroseus]KKK26771.1 hypothetical protein ARAM_000386 [Aspergillus rambellii]PTU20847.1 hypothetical protein P175DRAFT_0501483 [Aspergillus ochraceoroseus IBT 24754]
MEIEDIIRGVQPRIGEVVPVKTVQETQPIEEFAEAYVAEVSVRSASKVIKVLDSNFSRDASQPMSHLRRFAKYSNLPEHLQTNFSKDKPSTKTIFVLVSPPLPDVDRLKELLAPFAPEPEDGPSTQPSEPAGQIILHTIKIPTLPPLNTTQADTWTKNLWPVIFNPAAARATVAPPVQVLNRTLGSIQPDAGYYIALAHRVADEAEQSGRGRRVGAVVVDPEITSRILETADDADSRWADAIVAVAGDARYARREAGALSESEIQLGIGPNPDRETYNPDLEGGPDLHALMRVVEIIAFKRRAEDPDAENDKPDLSPLESYFLSQMDSTSLESLDVSPVPEKYQKTEKGPQPVAMSSEEVLATRIRPRSQGGYLCTDLDVYLTHEPCICCCMGLLLSRFRSVTFHRQGRMVTGGLASEPVVTPVSEPVEHDDPGCEDKKRLYYGIHWRKELNWRALGFEFIEDEVSGQKLAEDGIAFHA